MDYLNLTVGEFRLMVVRKRLYLLRIPIVWGFVWAYTGEWALWSKRNTPSRLIAQLVGIEVVDGF